MPACWWEKAGYTLKWDPLADAVLTFEGVIPPDPFAVFHRDQVVPVYLIANHLVALLPPGLRAGIDADHRSPDPYYEILPDVMGRPGLEDVAEAILNLMQRECGSRPMPG
jgi:hypothetical protein